jgi:hypothetical protein
MTEINLLKINVNDRIYKDYSFVCAKTLAPVDLDISRQTIIKHKLFNQDIFQYNSANNSCSIEKSSLRSMPVIPAVLVLEGKRTFGKWKRGRKLLFKCVPDDRQMPIFLVPYEVKNMFSKRLFNKYTVIKFRSWDTKHPIATIVQTIGDVNKLENFYEYQLYCKSLFISMQELKKETMRKLKNTNQEVIIKEIFDKYQTEDRTDREIYTIDSSTSKDFDDAIGLVETKTTAILSIYIANVPLWLDVLDLWDSLSERVSTIYLPDRKRSMLPKILSEGLCSLQEKKQRFAFAIDVEFNKNDLTIINVTWINTLIKVTENLRHETLDKNHINYKKLFGFIKNINSKYTYVETIKNCHDVVAYCAILMNYLSAKKLLEFKTGIFRGMEINKTFVAPNTVPSDVQKFLKMWNSSGANYAKYEHLRTHDALDLDAYVHITSPIRRLVDILTMLQLQIKLQLVSYNKNMDTFYDKWTSDKSLEYINKTMRDTRRVQNDCSLLNICHQDKEKLLKEYIGYIFDKKLRTDGLYQYMVFLPELKTVNRFNSRHEKENLTKQNFRLYVFMDENQLKQKLRIELLDQ